MIRKFRVRPHGAMPLSAPSDQDPLCPQPPGTANPVTRLHGRVPERATEEQATERWADEGGSPSSSEPDREERSPSEDYVD